MQRWRFRRTARPTPSSAKSLPTSRGTTSSLLYSLAFLYESPGVVLDAIKAVTNDKNIFVYGISDKHVGGLDVQDPSGNVAPVFAAELGANVPEPFKSEPTGGTGTRMHHKFTVIDFDKPTARVYLGSYNFSTPADRKNGENLVVVRDRRIAVSYMIEALSLFDHYSFRVAMKTASAKGEKLHLVEAAARRRRKAVVERRLYGRAQDQGSRAVFLTPARRPRPVGGGRPAFVP